MSESPFQKARKKYSVGITFLQSTYTILDSSFQNSKTLFLEYIDSRLTSTPLLFSLMVVAFMLSKLLMRFVFPSSFFMDLHLNCSAFGFDLNFYFCSWKWRMVMKLMQCFIRLEVMYSEPICFLSH